jgi:hypothetical protein
MLDYALTHAFLALLVGLRPDPIGFTKSSTTATGVLAMALTMRPTGLGHGVYKDDIDYSVLSGEWLIGRIYERRGFPENVRWF